MSDGIKTCTRCFKSYPETQEFFRPQPKGRNGLESQCRECRNSDRRDWYSKNAERRAAETRQWYYKNTEKAKETRQEYYESHKKQLRDANNRWKAKNKDKVKEHSRRSRSRRRALLAATKVEHYTEKQVLNTYGPKCHICGDYIDLSAPRTATNEGWERGLHIDHLVPVSLSGPDTLSNVRPSHALCNLRKSNKADTMYGQSMTSEVCEKDGMEP